jgi:hypothetical protein
MEEKGKEGTTSQEMLKKSKRGKVGMIGIPQQHPMTPEELEKFEESYRKALAKKVRNLYKKAGEKE